jgi:hypothetical protein
VRLCQVYNSCLEMTRRHIHDHKVVCRYLMRCLMSTGFACVVMDLAPDLTIRIMVTVSVQAIPSNSRLAQ